MLVYLYVGMFVRVYDGLLFVCVVVYVRMCVCSCVCMLVLPYGWTSVCLKDCMRVCVYDCMFVCWWVFVIVLL